MTRLAPETIATIEQFWSSFLGCEPDQFHTARTIAVQHADTLADYQGIFIFQCLEALVVSVPAYLLDRIRSEAECLEASDLYRVGRIQALSGSSAGRLIGPVYHGYADAASLCPVGNAHVRLLAAADQAALDDLRAAFGIEEWQEAGSMTLDLPLAGRFVGSTLVAVAGYKVWEECLAHICVATHPGQRGQGFGMAVASSISETALRHRLVPQYRALETNRASVSIARRLGFEHYATTIALRLEQAPAPI